MSGHSTHRVAMKKTISVIIVSLLQEGKGGTKKRSNIEVAAFFISPIWRLG